MDVGDTNSISYVTIILTHLSDETAIKSFVTGLADEIELFSSEAVCVILFQQPRVWRICNLRGQSHIIMDAPQAAPRAVFD